MQLISANLARGALDAAPDAMVIVDDAGIVRYANCRVTSLFGYYHDEVIGNPVNRLLPERSCANVARRWDGGLHPASAAAAAARGMDLIGRRRDGTEFPVEICLCPVPDARRILVLTTIRDVSDRRRAEIEMIRAREQAEHTTECADRANRLKSRILATASHDLRQPLQAVSLLNGMLRRTVSQAAAVTALAQQHHAIDAMSRLINALLDISKLESGAVRPTMTDFAVDSLFEELRLEFSELAAAKGLRLEVVSRGERIYSDRALVEQVLTNLLSNAIKYSRHGTVTLRCVQYDDASVRIAVADTGVGIPPERLGLIYDEFYQCAAPAGECREGYGLGLSIVQRIVKLLNLDLHVQSEVGVGSLFSLVMPAGDRALHAGQHAKPFCPDREPAPVDRFCVLLVEDDAAIRNATQMLLRVEGYQVTAVAALAEAVARAKQVPRLDLLITDYRLLDGHSGMQVVAAVREELGKPVRTLMVTGDTTVAMKDLPRDSNLRIMRKPIRTEEFLHTLNTMLAS